MSEYIIENEVLKAVINSKGCELTSVVRKSDNGEFMWDGNPDAWKRHSPVLFPLIGKYKNDTCHYNGYEYHMSQHGFARDMEFALVNKTDTSIIMKLTETEETLAKYPFTFELECGFELQENSIKVIWNVMNTNNIDMFFSIGGHPAFVNPDKKGSLAGCSLDFNTSADSIKYSLLDDNGLLTDEIHSLQLTSRVDSINAHAEQHWNNENISHDTNHNINNNANHNTNCNVNNNANRNIKTATITSDMFDLDAMVIENTQASQVSLSYENKPFVTVDFSAPVFGIWSPVKKNVPFVCIEPWYGRADRASFNGELSEREWGNTLGANETFSRDYTITFATL